MGGQSNVMTNQAKLDTGCGIYSYSISAPSSARPPPPATPTVGPIQCAANLPSYSKCWNDIHPSSVESCISAMAAQIPNEPMTSSSPFNVTQVLREHASGGQGGRGVTYSTLLLSLELQLSTLDTKANCWVDEVMNIGWIPNCADYPSQAADNPMGKSGDSTESYTTLIRSTYSECTSPLISFLPLRP